MTDVKLCGSFFVCASDDHVKMADQSPVMYIKTVSSISNFHENYIHLTLK